MDSLKKSKDIAHNFTVPVEADSADCPKVVYGPSLTAIEMKRSYDLWVK